MVTMLNPSTLCPPIGDLYSQITIVPAGRLAFVAGQVALDTSGALVGAGDHAAQARQCFRNIAAALDALGAAPADIAKMTLNVVNHRDDLVGPIFGAGHDVFGEDWPQCASIFLGVQRLGLADWLVEIDVVVALPG